MKDLKLLQIKWPSLVICVWSQPSQDHLKLIKYHSKQLSPYSPIGQYTHCQCICCSYLEAAVLEGGDPLASTLGCQQWLGALVGRHRHQLDGAVLAAGRQVGVAVVEDEGAHPGLELETLADLSSAEVVHQDGVVAADEEVLLGGPGELDDGGAGDALELDLLGGVLVVLGVGQHHLVLPLHGRGHTPVVHTPTVPTVPAIWTIHNTMLCYGME